MWWVERLSQCASATSSIPFRIEACGTTLSGFSLFDAPRSPDLGQSVIFSMQEEESYFSVRNKVAEPYMRQLMYRHNYMHLRAKLRDDPWKSRSHFKATFLSALSLRTRGLTSSSCLRYMKVAPIVVHHLGCYPGKAYHCRYFGSLRGSGPKGVGLP